MARLATVLCVVAAALAAPAAAAGPDSAELVGKVRSERVGRPDGVVAAVSPRPRAPPPQMAAEPSFVEVHEMLRSDVPAVKIAEHVEQVVGTVVRYLQSTTEQRARAEAAFQLQADQLDHSLDAAADEERKARACIEAAREEAEGLQGRVDTRHEALDHAGFREAKQRLEALERRRSKIVSRHRQTLASHEKQLEHLASIRSLIGDIVGMLKQHRVGDAKAGDAVPAALIQLRDADPAAERTLREGGVSRSAPTVGAELERLLGELSQSFGDQHGHVRALHRTAKDIHGQRMDALDREAASHQATVRAFEEAQGGVHAATADAREGAAASRSRAAECESRYAAAHRKATQLRRQKQSLRRVAEAELSHYDAAVAEMREQVEMGREIIHLVRTAVDDARVYARNPLARVEGGLPSATGVGAMMKATERRVEGELLDAAEDMAAEAGRARDEEESAKAASGTTGATGSATAAAAAEHALQSTVDRMQGRAAQRGPLPAGARAMDKAVAAGTALPTPATAATATADGTEQQEEEDRLRREEEADAKLRARLIRGARRDFRERVEDAVERSERQGGAPPAANARQVPAAGARSEEASSGAVFGAVTTAQNALHAAEAASPKEVADAGQPLIRRRVNALAEAEAQRSATGGPSRTDPLDRILEAAADGEKEPLRESTVGIVRASVKFHGLSADDMNEVRQWSVTRAVARATGVHPDSVRITTIVEVDAVTGDVLRTVEGKVQAEEEGRATPGYFGEPEGADAAGGSWAFRRRRLLSLSERAGGQQGALEHPGTDVVVSFDIQVRSRSVRDAAASLRRRLHDGVLATLFKEERIRARFTADSEPMAVFIPVLVPTVAPTGAAGPEQARQPQQQAPARARKAAPEGQEDATVEAAVVPEGTKVPEEVDTERVEEGAVPVDCPKCVNRTIVKERVRFVVEYKNRTIRVKERDPQAEERAAMAELSVVQLKRQVRELKERHDEESRELRAAREKSLAELEAKLEEEKDAALEKKDEEHHKAAEKLRSQVGSLREELAEEERARKAERERYDAALAAKARESEVAGNVATEEARVEADAEARQRAEQELRAQRKAFLAQILEAKKAAAEKAVAEKQQAFNRRMEALEEASDQEKLESTRKVYEAKEEAARKLEEEHSRYKELVKRYEEEHELSEELEKELAAKMAQAGGGAGAGAGASTPSSAVAGGGSGEVTVNQDVVENEEVAGAEREAALAEERASAERERLEAEEAALRKAKEAAAREAGADVDADADADVTSAAGGAAGGDLGASDSADMGSRAFYMLQHSGVTEDKVEQFLSSMSGATGVASPFGAARRGADAGERALGLTGVEGEPPLPGAAPLSERQREEEVAREGADAADRIVRRADALSRIAVQEKRVQQQRARARATEAKAQRKRKAARYQRDHAVQHLQALERAHYAEKSRLDTAARARVERRAKKAEALRDAEHDAAVSALARAKVEAEEGKREVKTQQAQVKRYHAHLAGAGKEVAAAKGALQKQRAEHKAEAARIVGEAKARAASMLSKAEAAAEACGEECDGE